MEFFLDTNIPLVVIKVTLIIKIVIICDKGAMSFSFIFVCKKIEKNSDMYLLNPIQDRFPV